MKVIAFGQIAEITGKEFSLVTPDTDQLRTKLADLFPDLSYRKYAIAVNKKVVSQNTALSENDEIALMPPYSGG